MTLIARGQKRCCLHAYGLLHVTEPIVIDKSDDESLEMKQQPQIADTVTQPNLGRTLLAKSKSTKKSKPSCLNIRSKATAPPAVHSPSAVFVESEDKEDTSECIATVFERLEVARKPLKVHKTNLKSLLGKGKTKGKGKERAKPAILVADSGDEISKASSSDETFPSEILTVSVDPHQAYTNDFNRTDWGNVIPDIRSGIRPFDCSGLDDDLLPPMLANWDTWHRTAFEQGNSQVFLKLATWMLLRFCQLSGTAMDADVNGMEHLYAAIAHMDIRPHFLSHLFHALGSLANNTDIGHSNHEAWPIASPPPVLPSMMLDMNVPWLSLAGDDRDGTYISEDMDVVHEDLAMGIKSQGSVSFYDFFIKFNINISKIEGGRGPTKCHKESPIGTTPSPAALEPQDATSDNLTSGQPLDNTPDELQADADAIGPDTVLPTPTQISERSTSTAADVNPLTLSSTNVNI
ncbi:hypothetical protein CY34DRAFT_14538 [Suillus luteus UH-Slu-Lm8-n1]|uniref:Uncharacterized protein n=1 Tax=Suillus luteus UH-Slu-Lm8-n1 TaxID=930992 RepID=A0A0D0AXV2_9AGAM|nr:hypothetical protein CY34DRAFT_14538 [Suillus luteus UH-Slu-Lm8-n1]